ncbi:MAG: hypothetical protein PHZ02_07170 [Desulfocapsaceae bacterium]|nr:hypothetical protein [Desulfocapsaceae bacterium]
MSENTRESTLTWHRITGEGGQDLPDASSVVWVYDEELDDVFRATIDWDDEDNVYWLDQDTDQRLPSPLWWADVSFPDDNEKPKKTEIGIDTVIPVFPVIPAFATIQSAIILAMKDLCENAKDTVWITNHETMFERLAQLHEMSGGKEETLAGIWPEHF